MVSVDVKHHVYLLTSTFTQLLNSEMHNTESRFVTRPSDMQFAGVYVYVCTFQPGACILQAGAVSCEGVNAVTSFASPQALTWTLASFL